MPGLVYDTGALLAAERRDVAFALLHEHAVRAGARPVVPAVVLAQAWRGGRQAGMSRLLQGCVILPVDGRLARAAGVACALAKTRDVVDAVVVVVAADLGAGVVTSDPDDVRHLADSVAIRLSVHRV